MTLNLFNTPTDNLNDEMDEADIETNLKRWREMPTQTRLTIILAMKEWKHVHKTKQIPHTSVRMGAMANDSPRCRIFYCCCCCCCICVCLLLLHACFFGGWGGGVLLLLCACVLSCNCVLLGLCVCGVSFFIS